MDIRQLQTFKTIVETGSFTQAARRLKYAQSTVTAHIQMLEEEMGGPLFDRLGKKTILTETGKDLYPYTVEMVRLLGKIKSIPGGRREIKGDLRIGASETLTVYRLGPLLASYKKHFPDVRLSLLNDNCARMREMLHSGELDIAYVLEPLKDDPGLTVQVIGEEPIVFVGGPECAVKSVCRANRAVLSEECIIFTEDRCSLRIFFESYLAAREITSRNTLSFSSMEAIKQCVSMGLGISLLPLVSAKGLLEENKLKKLECEEKVLPFYSQVVYHKSRWASPAQKKLIEMTAAYFEHL